MHDAVTYTEHAKRKTATAMDVLYMLKRQGLTQYDFGGWRMKNWHDGETLEPASVLKERLKFLW